MGRKISQLPLIDSYSADVQVVVRKGSQNGRMAAELLKGQDAAVDLSNLYTKPEVDEIIAELPIPAVDLRQYYSKPEIDALLMTVGGGGNSNFTLPVTINNSLLPLRLSLDPTSTTTPKLIVESDIDFDLAAMSIAIEEATQKNRGGVLKYFSRRLLPSEYNATDVAANFGLGSSTGSHFYHAYLISADGNSRSAISNEVEFGPDIWAALISGVDQPVQAGGSGITYGFDLDEPASVYVVATLNNAAPTGPQAKLGKNSLDAAALGADIAIGAVGATVDSLTTSSPLPSSVPIYLWGYPEDTAGNPGAVVSLGTFTSANVSSLSVTLVDYDQKAAGWQSDDGDNVLYTSVNFGAAAPDRKIQLDAYALDFSNAPKASMTMLVDGITDPIAMTPLQAYTGDARLTSWIADLPLGTTGKIRFGGNAFNSAIAVWRIVGAGAGVVVSKQFNSSAQPSVNVNTPAGGKTIVALYVEGSATAVTLNNATILQTLVAGGDYKFIIAQRTTAGSAAIGVQETVGYNALTAASYS